MPVPEGPAVRPATAGDLKPLSEALARAFADDPVLMWLFPPGRQTQRMAKYFAAEMRHVALGHGLTYTTPALEGGAIWLPPDKWRLTPRDLVRMLPSTIGAFGGRLPNALRALARVEKHHPREPHYYLATLGTDPAFQGKGVGGALLGPVLERCDTEGMPAYLESSKERNIAFYGRYGFEVTERLELGPDGPPVWLMWREPRA